MLLSRNRIKRIMGAAHSTGPRWCSSCREKKPRDHGREVASPDGLRQRWICSDCGGKHGG